ncbi:MAG: LacI family DNA-binding transcriptional regulator [Burkholderiales bacterium]|nr:LacI family DNA-binding transcriptional regulator [Opitutaceae bacterium]
MPKPFLTLANIAAKLGISTTAVSMALRGRPGVSEELRKKVVECAKEHGYQPNPVAVELMTWVRSQREAATDSTPIAFVTSFADPKLLERIYTFNAFLKGAARRGSDFGYHVEAFHGREPGMNPARLAQILKARGVRGVLLGPAWMDEPRVELDWKDFSVVMIGEVYLSANIYRVCNHHVQSCNLALRQLHALGYRRIAVAGVKKYEKSRGHEYLLGVDQFRRDEFPDTEVSTWLFNDWDGPAFAKWAKTHRIDAVVSNDPAPWDTVRTLKLPSGEAMGYANLDVPPGSPWSGINQHSEAIGETGMELLRQLLLAGERGTFLHPQIVLIDGTWVDGTTTRKAPPAAS